MSGWNGLDFFIFLILASNTVLGMSRGGQREVISMMCLSVGLIFAIQFTMPLTNFLNRSSVANDVVVSSVMQNFMIAIDAGPMTIDLLNQLMYSISLLVCFVGAFSVCEAGLAKAGFVEAYSLPTALVNRKVGGALGFVRGYIVTLIFLSILVLHVYAANNNIGKDFIAGSYFVDLFKGQMITLDGMISSRNAEQYQELYKNQPYKVEDLYKVLNKPEDITGGVPSVLPAPTTAPAPTPAAAPATTPASTTAQPASANTPSTTSPAQTPTAAPNPQPAAPQTGVSNKINPGYNIYAPGG